MKKKIVIVGGVAGGASTAARLRRLSEEDEIIMFDRGEDVSFSNCTLPYYLSGVVASVDDLLVMTPQQLQAALKTDVRVNTEVLGIDRENKTVTAKNLLTNEEYQESYDKLVLSPGANPIVPPFKGLDKVDYYTIRNVTDITRLKSDIEAKGVKDIVVIGGGFIGLETAENLQMAGYNVTIAEAAKQVMNPLDYDMAQFLQREIIDHGIDLIVGDAVDSFDDKTVILSSGKKLDTDAVVMAIGVSPETKLAKEADLEIGKTGAIKVNQNFQTNDPDIYALGDAVEKWFKLPHRYSKLALAGPAQKEARLVADHINGIPGRYRGVIGTSIIKVFGMNAASTGLTRDFIEAIDDFDIEFDTVVVASSDKVDNMPDSNLLFMKLVYEVPTGRVLGAQAVGRGDVKSRIDTIATAINFNATVYDLADLELAYAPPFGTARDSVNITAMAALNKLHDNVRTVDHTEMRKIVESGAFLIDARPYGFEEAHIKGAISMSPGEARNRLDELPKDEPIYIYCRIGKNSYFVYRILEQLGFENIYSVEGGLSVISNYEYYNDKMNDREPIVTNYHFGDE